MNKRQFTFNLTKKMSEETKLRQEELFLASLHCSHLGQEFKEKVRQAYRIAKVGHLEQLRDNGQPYFSHLCETTGILVNELGNRDCGLICACLLHDTLEDSETVFSREIGSEVITFNLIEIVFGRAVAELVVAVTKPKRLDERFSSDRERHEFYFNQLRQSGEEVKLLKLCDRLHSVRTLWNCHPNKRERKITETQDVYLPLIRDIYWKYPEEAKYLRRQFSFGLQSLANCPNTSKCEC